MALYVQKYGGSSLKSPDHILAATKQVAILRQGGHQVIVVVSAMGKTTDDLIQLAYQISPSPSRRELDMLLSTGERISMALVSMALSDLDCPAISFTGSQAGIMTCKSHSNARIIDIKPFRVEAELAKNNVVVLAGFQGVEPKAKEITTLGRGGTDTTAVAMAAHFKAKSCQFLKDVPGVMTGDPKYTKAPQTLSELSFEALLEMTFWGAKVLHYRSVELASCLSVPLFICSAHKGQSGTHIVRETKMYEQGQVLSINSLSSIKSVQIRNDHLAGAMKTFEDLLQTHQLPWPQILSTAYEEPYWSFYITAPEETLRAIESLFETESRITSDLCSIDLCSVTVTCQGSVSSNLSQQIVSHLDQQKIPVKQLIFSPMSLTLFLPASQRQSTLSLLHEKFLTKEMLCV